MSGKKQKGPTRACLITSERSGQSTLDLDGALSALLSQGWEVAVRQKQQKGDAIELARRAADEGYDPIVNCGGDGTLNELASALADTDVAVGVIPGGTENVWSKQVGISPRSRVAALQLASAHRARIDVGEVRIDGHHQQHFLMMAGLGADGAVMSRVSRSLKDRIGAAAVGVAAVESLPALRAVEVQADLDGVRWQGRVSEIIAGNIRDYGGFTRVTPEAYVDDGLLDVCFFTAGGVADAGRQMASLVFRRHPATSSAEIYRAARLTVRAPTPLPLQIDGSAVEHAEAGETEYTISVRPHALTVLVPRTYDGEIFAHPLDPDAHDGHAEGKGKKHKKKG